MVGGVPHVIVSAHLDDAVLSCFTLLTDPGRVLGSAGDTRGPADETPRVVNICCGLPPRDLITDWDKTCGASSSWALVHRRIGEDAELMAKLGVASYYLDILDQQYRSGLPEPDISTIVQGILDVVEVAEDTTVWMPWARYSGGNPTHVDHVLARAAGELAVADTGARGRYFADLPYLHEDALADGSDSELNVLSISAARDKLRACRAYETQWRYLKTSWRRVRNERYVEVAVRER
jgi:LmbE family N-acetylglucosaminyl deacetylase